MQGRHAAIRRDLKGFYRRRNAELDGKSHPEILGRVELAPIAVCRVGINLLVAVTDTVNRPGFVEASWLKSRRHRYGLIAELLVVVCLSVCRTDIYDGFKHSLVVKPGYPF
jgi:hypothetical protein